jgi:hypothetical protein
MKQRPNRFQISREPIIPERVRQIEGGFAFIEHRFLHRGFFATLSQAELVLYFLLVMVGDRRGISFYGNDALCSICRLSSEAYLLARNALIAKDLIAYDGLRFQVLSLPEHPVKEKSGPLIDDEDFDEHDPATIRQLICQSLGLNKASNSK